MTLDAPSLPPRAWDLCLCVARLSDVLQGAGRGRAGRAGSGGGRRTPCLAVPSPDTVVPGDARVWVIFMHVITAASLLSLHHKQLLLHLPDVLLSFFFFFFLRSKLSSLTQTYEGWFQRDAVGVGGGVMVSRTGSRTPH